MTGRPRAAKRAFPSAMAGWGAWFGRNPRPSNCRSTASTSSATTARPGVFPSGTPTTAADAPGWTWSLPAGARRSFPVVGTTEHLSCYEGRAAIQGHGVTVEALAWADQVVIALQIEDRRENPGEIHLDLRTLRPALVKTRFQSATSSLESRGAQLRLTQHFPGGEFLLRLGRHGRREWPPDPKRSGERSASFGW